MTAAANGRADEADAGSRLLAAELTTEIEFLTARARAIGSSRANTLLAPLGLKVRSYAVLSLACSGLNPSQRELADFLSLDPSQIVALVDQLEQRRAVTREQDPRDRRSKGITATDEGVRLHDEARNAIRRAEAESLAPLDTGEREQLRALLRRIAFDAAE
ncbi:MarR family winged helix-turn-helix transcriptional regulator [Leifsonia sp. Root112D2]|jgi:DNA-binding MarR family transcriptional regulator|uniref:MarR family winged helix-turn-helix transcriptional regulator n=1 Tax=Leifsonia sp. Root112D2 TaxID=1736426 RepID=UPI0006FC8530|nr:MarR family transcriptional regulator [Leifsonia sp. Root112D2]KQV05127.1 MarR family transcriptional regulator [Leifsonia sp. Root112D2]